jgi:hypothetical protein
VNALSNSPTTTASNAQSTAARLLQQRSRMRTLLPRDPSRTTDVEELHGDHTCPATSAEAISRCHARDVAGSWNSAVDVRP